MIFKLSKYICSLGIVLMCQYVKGTHIIGGEMHYTFIGGSVYEVTLKIYRDCGPANTANTQYDNPSYLAVYGGGQLVETLELYDPIIVRLPNVLDNPCLTFPDNICVEEATYTYRVSLPKTMDGYTIVWQRCCRNSTILNIKTPNEYGLTLFLKIPGNMQTLGNNSSPYFKNIMPLAFCLGDQISFDHSAIDADGDSLVYSLTSAYTGATPGDPRPTVPAAPPFEKILWEDGYSDEYPIDSDPKILIDPITGMLSLKTTKLGAFTFGVSVSEYRNGVLLSTSIRDFQFNVNFCAENVKAGIKDQSVFCEGLSIPVQDSSINGSFYHWAVGSLTNPFYSSGDKDPMLNFFDYGNHLVYLILNPGYSCADTVSKIFSIREKLKLAMDAQPIQCITSNNFNLKVSGNIKTGATFNWTLPANATIGNNAGAMLNGVKFNAPGFYPYEVFVTSDGCTATVSDTLEVESTFIEADFLKQDVFCTGPIYSFTNKSRFTNHIAWVFPFDTIYEENPTVLFPDTGVYPFTLIAGGSADCADTATGFISLKPDYKVFFQLPDSICFDNNLVNVDLQGTDLGTNYTTTWSVIGNEPVTKAGDDSFQHFSFLSEGKKIIHAEVFAYGCSRNYEDTLMILPNPTANFIASVADGCVPLDVSFKLDKPTSYSPIYSWKLDGIEIDTSENFSHHFDKPGMFLAQLEIITNSGCLDTVGYVLPNPIDVHPLPELGFNVLNFKASIDVPEFTALSSLMDNSRLVFKLENGQMSRDSIYHFVYPKAGESFVMQINTSVFGCVDSLRKPIQVIGSTVYVPNSFTPNDDGYNDFFKPIVSEGKSYKLTIWDKWGEVIFSTTNANDSWDGNLYNTPCQMGVYTYVLEFVDLFGITSSYNGHINLLR